MLVIAGRVSLTGDDLEALKSNKRATHLRCSYQLSYLRAYSLYQLWKSKGIDFDAPPYNKYVDLHLSGNGFGGAGRFPRNGAAGSYDSKSEARDQGIIVEIVPKIGDLLIEK